MKKSFLLIAVLLTTAMASAQIELIKTFDAHFDFYFNQLNYPSPVKIDKLAAISQVAERQDSVILFNEDFSVYRQYRFDGEIYYVTQNLCSTSGKIEFLVCKRIGNYPNEIAEIKIFDEDGSVIKDLGTFNTIEGSVMFISIGEDKHMLVIGDFLQSSAEGNNTGKTIERTQIYSVPGNGKPTTGLFDAPSCSAPRANRKALRNGNVFVDTPEHIYTIGGQVMK